jgi:cobalt/nickel transport system permease protein
MSDASPDRNPLRANPERRGVCAEGPLHRLPAALKLAAALIIIVGTVLLPAGRIGWLVGEGLALMLAAVVSRIPPLILIRRLAMLLPFTLGVALVGMLDPGESVDWRIIAVKSTLCLLTVILLSHTTPLGEIIRVLQRMRVPGLLVTTMALMHRYLFVLSDEAGHMRRARASRTFTRGRRFAWSALATVVSRLFIRASERAERIYDAMCARGWR